MTREHRALRGAFSRAILVGDAPAVLGLETSDEWIFRLLAQQ